MKNTSVSLLRQVLDLIPKREFEEIVMKYDGDKRKQSFDFWAYFVLMIFFQPPQVNSLREICGGLSTCGGKLNNLGIEGAPGQVESFVCRSTSGPGILRNFSSSY